MEIVPNKANYLRNSQALCTPLLYVYTVHIAQTQLANPNEPYTLYSDVRGPVVLDLEVTVGGGPVFCY